MEGQTSQEDVVGSDGRFPIGLADADESCPGDLDDGRNHIGCDEDAQDRSLRKAKGTQPLCTSSIVVTGQRCDERGKGGVNGRAEEDGRRDDEEVLYHEVDHTVGVSNRWRRGAEAEDVADDFAEGGEDQENGECVETGRVEAEGVEEEEKGE